MPDFKPYSYLSDTNVPEFSAGKTFAVMDARCGLCAKGAVWIAHNDKAFEFRIIPLQSDVGAALMRHYRMNPFDPASWLYVEDGKAHTSLDAVIQIGARLGGRWKGLRILRILPHPVQEFLYRTIARKRYRLFGSRDMCRLPDPEVQKRLLKESP
ncbi:thiol-disulfide oxidoreductase DCC family protein [Roseibium sp. RKSG952]|uniref:thiol-disulfide oxidoreductase DCC family protein n=1 Tax=Roseibium sp. RKSG952 TaxID=2529384 RepID=UPI0012BD5F2E|nr:DCC1-like thiol-disulfide oxidoreductase family protein [Roseibium sp. RKSG952]MTI00046.1 DUF393 domain-containing protein [Roseibium sp. RKSG952]